ncbi:MAG TPA: ATP-binding protein [Micropepsaceae bacterium]|nr:ATP-binding protein [Micropepsaceae bacterium]
MRLRFKSILQRIISLHVLALAGVFGAITFAVWFVLGATANNFEQRLLLDHATTVAQYLQLNADRWTVDLPPDLAALYGRGYGGYALAIIDENGRVVSSSLPRREALFAPDIPPQAPAFFQQRSGKAAFYGIDFPVRKGNRSATIEVAQDLANADVIVDDVVAGFVSRLAWVVLPMFALLLALDVLIVRRALKPITTASQRARKIHPGTIGLRLPDTGLPDEVLPLVVAVNEALDRLERGFQMQRDLTADAAHELRTPLAILMTMIDVSADQKLAAELRPQILGMSRIVGQLLELAELESSTIGEEDAADLRAVCCEAVSLMAPVALAQGKTIELNAPSAPVWVQGNAELLFRAVRNLVENAIRYTAAATAVEVDVLASGAVTVKDRGPGVPPKERELIFRRFWRQDRRGGPNAGLGLSIVQRAIQIHGGNVGVGEREGGGAVFSIALPVRIKSISHSITL